MCKYGQFGVLIICFCLAFQLVAENSAMAKDSTKTLSADLLATVAKTPAIRVFAKNSSAPKLSSTPVAGLYGIDQWTKHVRASNRTRGYGWGVTPTDFTPPRPPKYPVVPVVHAAPTPVK